MSDATNPPITVFSGTDSSNNNTNWTFVSACPPNVSLTPATVSVIVTTSQTFAVGGGFAPYTFGLATNNSGGSIHPTTGQYTAGTTPNVTDIVRVTDVFGATADATVNVTTGPPAQLAFLTQPTDGVAGQILAPAVQVAVRDQFGNLVANATNAITLSARDNPCGGFLSGDNLRNAVNGIATFNDLHVSIACDDYILDAHSNSLSIAESNPFTIVAAAPSALRFVTQPTATDALALISAAVEVAIEDDFGNRVRTATHPVTLALDFNSGNGVLSGTLTRNAVNGLAVFDDLSLNSPADNYILKATSGNLFSPTSIPFVIRRQIFFVRNPNDASSWPYQEGKLR